MINPDDEQSGEPKHKQFVIIVNGRKKEVDSDVLTYGSILDIAYDNNPPQDPNVVITVTYGRGDKQGTLISGQEIKIKEGMIFNVYATNRS